MLQPDQPVAFVHVPKTGGTSISDWIAQHYPESEQFVPANAADFRARASAETSCGADNIRHRLIRGHCNTRDVVRFANQIDGEERIIFTMLRRPEGQIMSLLWHVVSQKLGLTVGRTHAQYDSNLYAGEMLSAAIEIEGQTETSQFSMFIDPTVERILLEKPEIEGDLCEQVREEAFRCIHVVGLTERFSDSVRLFAHHLALPLPDKMPEARVSKAGEYQMPPEIREVYRRRLALDMIVYEEAERRFERQFEAFLEEQR